LVRNIEEWTAFPHENEGFRLMIELIESLVGDINQSVIKAEKAQVMAGQAFIINN